ncbi:MAG: hypothetical protein ABSD41_03960 [Candidatus Bathyarchaeia archaeon]|jgi:hypothetical protein
MASRRANSIIAILIILLITLTIASIPSVPEITAAVLISTTPNHHPSITLVSIVYQRVSLLASLSESKDKVQVSSSASTYAPSSVHYYLSVVVQYQNRMVTQGGSDLNDGSYVIKASFWPITETPNTPYVVTMTVSQGGYYYSTVEAKLSPA